MKVIVTGGRTYRDLDTLSRVLDALDPALVIEGGANGADQLASFWAAHNSVALKTYEAHWDDFGRSAGPRRNKIMLQDNPDAIVVAFPGGHGTQDCIGQARRFGMIVLRVEE